MPKGKEVFLILVFLFLIPSVSASVVINEIEQNPAGDDRRNEWVELYSIEEIDLTGWKLINGDNGTFILNNTINGYLVIIFPSQWLDNPNETVTLMNSNESIIDETPLLSDSSNNAFSWSFCESEWQFVTSTPGAANACSEEQEPPDEEEQEETGDNSIIRIEDYPDDAEFGETIKVEIYIYKGDTSKYAIYAYVENEDDDRVSEKTTIHAKSKFTEYKMTIPIQLKSNCDGKYDDGEHTIIIEGLGEKDKEDMDIEGITSSLCGSQTTSTTSSRKKLNYDITLPEKFEINKEFSTKVKITNGKSEDISLKIWSYLYRSSKCYSCESNREENAKEITVKSGEIEEITLKNKVVQAEPGNYRFKVKVQEPQLVNPREFTYDIKLEAAEATEQQSIETTQTITGAATKGTSINPIYIANSRTLRNMGIILLIITTILLTVIMWKKGLI